MGTGRGAKDTDLTKGGCVDRVVVTIERGAMELVGKAEEDRLTEEVREGTPEEAMVRDCVDFGIVKDKLLPPAVDRELLFLLTELAEGSEGRLPERLDDSLTPGRGLEVSFEVEAVVVVDRVDCEGNEVRDMDSVV